MVPTCPPDGPRANRVQPDGTFLATAERGWFTGNRGILHDATGAMGRARWRHKAWITCTIRPRPGRAPLPMAARGHYTPLFFLDEAVACAAGHRPCAECRRAVWHDFAAAWGRAFGTVPRAPQVDAALHVARIDRASRAQRRITVEAAQLPDGTFILMQDRPHLVRNGAALRYAPAGYGPPCALPAGPVTVLTPAPMLAVMQAGWRPAFSTTEDRPSW